MVNPAKSTTAVAAIERTLECLPTSDGKVVKLVQFGHQSPGLIELRHRIAEALVMVIEQSHVITPK